MLQLLSTLFVSPAAPTETNLVDSLDDEEKSCYKKILDDLMHSSYATPRVKHTGIAPKKITNKPMYAIEFRQSESWDTIDSLFLGILSKDPAIQNWSKYWLNCISALRGEQTRLYCIGQKISDAKKADDKTKIATGQKNLIATNRKIISILRAAEQEIFPKNYKMPLASQCQRLANLLKKTWPNLILFSEWPEISMAERKLAVRLIGPHQIITEKKCEGSLKNFFIIEEIDVLETEEKKDGYSILTTQKIGLLTEKKISSKSESSKISKTESPIGPRAIKRAKSANRLVSDTLFSNYNFTIEAPIENPQDLKVQYIVQLAINKVNQNLKLERPVLKLSTDQSSSDSLSGSGPLEN